VIEQFRFFLLTPTLLFVSLPAQVFGGPGILDRYVVTSWTHESGLPTSWVSAVTQDRQGYLWLGTKDGLIRFDGLKFSRVEFANEPPLPDRSIVSLCAARDGSLWIGYAVRGVSRLGPDGRLQNFGQREGFAGRRVRGLTQDQRGTIWASTRGGLFRFLNEQWERVDARLGLADGPAYTVYEDSVGNLWTGTATGVYRRESGQDRFQLVDASIQHSPSFSEGPSGTVWITDPDVGVRKLVDRDGLKGGSQAMGMGVALLQERRGNLWVATFGQGLWLVRQDRTSAPTIETMTTRDGLLSDTVLSLFEDVEANVWVGTQAGLHKFAPRRVTPVTDVGLVRAVVAALDGDVWVATASGLLRFSSGERRMYGRRDGLPSSSARALHIDRSGVLWVATDRGVARFVNGRFSSLPLIERAWPTRIMAIATDLDGNIWICDQDYGLFRWKDARLTTIDPSPEVSHSTIDNLVSDRDGRVWLIVAGGGLGCLTWPASSPRCAAAIP
jgi:ligand-binding sensor domain-containing protein